MTKKILSEGMIVDINIAQGMSKAKGKILKVDYGEDEPLYLMEVIEGDNCNFHRDRQGELWVWSFEIVNAI